MRTLGLFLLTSVWLVAQEAGAAKAEPVILSESPTPDEPASKTSSEPEQLENLPEGEEARSVGPDANEEPGKGYGSQKDDRGPIGRGFGKRWVAMPTVSSNPKLSTSFGAVAAIFYRFDDSVASTAAFAGSYSVSKSWMGIIFGKLNFNHDRQRIIMGLLRGHATNTYDNFLNEGIPLNSESNIWAAPLYYFHRLGPRHRSNAWLGGQVFYVGLGQVGDDEQSQEIIDYLGLTGSHAVS
ncbi:MAG: hypothetical protein MK135_15590, partial [Polyangiaceae bacterium]|nr:hypothetical protein [Polyangiaceae bacterium]